MKLQEAIQKIENLNDNAGICVFSNEVVHLESEIVLQEPVGESDPIPPEGMYELMSVFHARETLVGLRHLLTGQNGVTPSEDQLSKRFLLFLENDA